MDRMNPLDASFLAIEDDNNPMHIGNVSIFEGPPPSYGDVVRMVASKLPLVPRYRQKVRMVPFQLGRPVWVDDPHFQILYHIRHTAVPSPGGDDQLRNLAGRVFAQNLDRSKPLWEMWIVEGLKGGRWALISKVHHSMVDGVSGTDLMTVLLDQSATVEAPVIEPFDPPAEPSTLEVLLDMLADRVVQPVEALRGLPALARSPLPGGMSMGDALRSAKAYLDIAVGRTADLNGPIGPHRRWSWAKSSLADVKVIRESLPGTVNDVVLAVITRGFRDLLLSRGAEVEGRVVRTMVPVSVRSEQEKGTFNNRVSAMFPGLPVGLDDPVERLMDIQRQMNHLKETKMAAGADTIMQMAGFAPPMLLALGTRLGSRLPQRALNTVTTNVPGPRFPLYIAGRQMLEAYPFVPIEGNVRIAIAIFSYMGGLNYGITADYDTTADIGVLADGIEDGMREYLRIAKRRSSAGAGDAGAGKATPANAGGVRARSAAAHPVAPRGKRAKSATPGSGTLMDVVTTASAATNGHGTNGASRPKPARKARRKSTTKGRPATRK